MSKFSVGDVVAVKDDPWQKQWTVEGFQHSWVDIITQDDWDSEHEDNLEPWTVEN